MCLRCGFVGFSLTVDCGQAVSNSGPMIRTWVIALSIESAPIVADPCLRADKPDASV